MLALKRLHTLTQFIRPCFEIRDKKKVRQDGALDIQNISLHK